MQILHRYILKEHIGPFFFGLFTVLFILIVDLILQMMDLFISKGIALRVVLEFFFLSLAWMLALAIPMAVLVATLMAFGRLSADNEITAIRSGGISLYRLISPVLLLSMAMALGLVEFNNTVLPEFNHRARKLITALHRKKPALALKDREGVFINDFEGYNLLVEKVDHRHSKIYGVTIFQDESGGELPVIIRAESGYLDFSISDDKLTMILYNGEIHQIDPQDPKRYLRTSFKKHVIYLSNIGQRLEIANESRGDREMRVEMMIDKVKQANTQMVAYQGIIKGLTKEYLKRKALQGNTEPKAYVSQRKDMADLGLHRSGKDFEMIRFLRRIETLRQEIEMKKETINRYTVEIHKKFSIPVACIVFVLVGAPLGIRVRRGGIAVGIGLSIVFFVIYWAFLIGGEELADRLIVHPALAMWSPNIFIGAVGIYLVMSIVGEVHPFWRRKVKLPPTNELAD